MAYYPKPGKYDPEDWPGSQFIDRIEKCWFNSPIQGSVTISTPWRFDSPQEDPHEDSPEDLFEPEGVCPYDMTPTPDDKPLLGVVSVYWPEMGGNCFFGAQLFMDVVSRSEENYNVDLGAQL